MNKNFQFDVFLSHNHEDKPRVRRLAERLKNAGLRVWFDEWNVRSGDIIALKVDEGLEQSRVLLLCISPNALGSGWVALERSTAIHRDPASAGRRFIPLLLADCELPDTLQRYKYVDFRGENDTSFEELLKEVQSSRAVTAVWYLPDYNKNLSFTGRSAELNEIRNQLLRTGAVAVTQTIALTGLGGIGKTQTAIEYAFQHRDEYRYVFFLHADDPEKIKNDYLAISTLLNLQHHEKDPQLRVEGVIRWLERECRWLLIVDNVDSPAGVASLLPRAGKGHILVTSRLRNLDHLGRAIGSPVEIGRWTPQESLRFLERETGYLVGSDPGEDEAINRLVKALDGLPLAHSQAATFIRRLKIRFQDYWREFQQRRTELFVDSEAALLDYPESVVTTWLINFKQVMSEAELRRDEPYGAAPDLLLASAFLSPDDIPMDLLSAGAEELGPNVVHALQGAGEGSLKVNQALHLLHELSLIEVKVEFRSYRMHRLVQEVVRKTWMDATQRAEWAKRVIRMLNRATHFLTVHYGNWPDAIGKQHHANFISSIVMDEWKRADFEFDEAAALLTKTGFMLTNAKRFQDAARLLDRALHVRERLFGSKHPRVAETLTCIGDNQTDANSEEQALVHYMRALKIRVTEQGLDGSDVAQIHNNLGIALYKLRRDKEAETHYREAERIWTLSGQRNLVGSIQFNLGQIYDRHGKVGEAEQHFREAFEKITSPLNMRATVARVLGMLLARLDRDTEAVEFLREAVKCSKRAFGDESQHVLQCIEPLESVLMRLGLENELAELTRLKQRIEH